MGLLSRRTHYDRSRLLEEAARARSRGRLRRAIALYRCVLVVEPGNAELHARLAPLLAARGEELDAWTSFRVAARACLRDKRAEAALEVYREAARCLPLRIEIWEAIARIEAGRGQRRAAFEALREGRRHMRGAERRAAAVALLRRARELAPWDPETVLDLARLLARSDQAYEARLLLEQLALRCEGPALRRVRAAQWRLAPSPRLTWQWLRAAYEGLRAGREASGAATPSLSRPSSGR